MGRLIDADKIMDKMESIFDMQELYLPIHFKELIIDDMPSIEAILKADYENRLKADMVAILDKVRNEIDKIHEREGSSFDCLNALDELKEFIDKIKAERGVEDGKHF